KALPDLTVQTRSAGPYRIEVEYGGAVGFPSLGDGSSSAKRPHGVDASKPAPVPAHIVELAARTPPASPVVVIRVKDSRGEPVPDLAVRLVSRGSAGAGLRPISASFRSSRGVGLAVTDTNGEATGRLYFSGEAAVAKPGLAQVMVCVGEAAERSVDLLNAEVDAEGAITAEHRFTGHSIQFAEASSDSGKVRLEVPLMPQGPLLVMEDPFEPTIPELSLGGLGIGPRPRLLDDTEFPGLYLNASVFPRYAAMPSDSRFEGRVATGAAIVAEILFGIVAPVPGDFLQLYKVVFYDTFVKGEPLNKVAATLAFGMLLVDTGEIAVLGPVGQVVGAFGKWVLRRISIPVSRGATLIRAAYWACAATLERPVFHAAVSSTGKSLRLLREGWSRLAELIQNTLYGLGLRRPSGQTAKTIEEPVEGAAVPVAREAASLLSRTAAAAGRVIDSRGASAELANALATEIEEVARAFSGSLHDDALDAIGDYLMAQAERAASEAGGTIGEAVLKVASKRANEVQKRVEVLMTAGGPLAAFAKRPGVEVATALDELMASTYLVARQAKTALSQQAMETIASIIAHPRFLASPGRGLEIAQTISRNLFYSKSRVLERTLEALQAPAARGRRLIDVENAAQVLEELATANNRGSAYAVVVAGERYRGRVGDLGFRRSANSSDVDILMDDAFVEVKNKSRLTDDDLIQLRERVVPEYQSIDPNRRRLPIMNPDTRPDPGFLESIERELNFSWDLDPAFPL
ncbi:MAG: hypothetical protein HY303_00540, partial [Candidatus Wallbacteria bacterium]|nr:hypothetical protein [Candidatus Wallbacteria bacterium]